MTVGIVTDSTAYLPQAVTSRLGIEVVPVQVIVDDVAYDESGGISVSEVAKALRASKSVTTSRPSPDQFVAAYQRLIDRGCTSIVSVHLSSVLSGTYESALLASKRLDIPVDVIDSRGIAMMMGFAIESGAALAHGGAHHEDVATVIRDRCAKASVIFYVDTLEFLQRGGRISTLRSRVGSALHVKPILHMLNGTVESRELVRTSGKAIPRLIEICNELATPDCDIAVHHVDANERADEVAQMLCERLGRTAITVTEAGAVVGAHVGPGAVAVVISPQ